MSLEHRIGALGLLEPRGSSVKLAFAAAPAGRKKTGIFFTRPVDSGLRSTDYREPSARPRIALTGEHVRCAGSATSASDGSGTIMGETRPSRSRSVVVW